MRFVPAIGALCMVGALFLPPLASVHAQAPLGQSDVEEALTCQCGCGLTVSTCNHLECSFAVPVRKDIAESLARGESGQAILERYKKEYGEKVLSSPVAEGFNILAWIAPYLAIVVAGSIMFLVLRRRAAAGANAPTPSPTSAHSAADDDRLSRLRQEVEDLEQ